MTWKNRLVTVTSTGTLADFFQCVKEAILGNTDFELISEDVDDYSLTFDTKVEGVTLAVTDANATGSASQSTITCTALKVSYTKSSSLCVSGNISYSASGMKVASTGNRTIYLNVYTGASMRGMNWFSTNASLYPSTGAVAFSWSRSKTLDGTTDVERYRLGTNFVGVDEADSTATWLSAPLSSSATGGIVYFPQLLVAGGKYVEYIPDVYTCTTVTAFQNYKIGKDTFYAIDTNTLIKV
jgi:hypothetical protein